MENTEWLKSLSDKQLADEIHHGRVLAASDRHKQHRTRELQEAIAEMKRRRDGE